jgi:hypothetical protein
VLSEVDRDFSQEVRNYFRERIVDSLMTAAVEAVQDPRSASPVPELATGILTDDATFVAGSQDIARHLYECQNAVNNPGLLTVALGKVEQSDCICILKLEKEEVFASVGSASATK